MASQDGCERRTDKEPLNSKATFSVGDLEEDSYDGRRIRLGVCAMAKKVNSKPMVEIVGRLQRLGFLDIHVFSEDTIVNEPVDQWPIVDCLISFHSNGFPLNKAVEYELLRSPLLINDLGKQYELMDRRAVHSILEEQGIDQPKWAVVMRDSSPQHSPARLNNSSGAGLILEQDDHLEVNGTHFHKPFVEKPLSAEDHNVYIYYPSAAGGGSQRLFRKTGNRSSVYSPVSRVRTSGSYVYEEFMPTDGTDVKVYTVGPDYAHAEARKSPALDGKVERDKSGKEVRYPVILTAKEKTIARKICLAFKQTVCGFDLLRANGVSYVCDVNGFSFVKTSPKYYDDCATVIGTMTLRLLAPSLSLPLPPSLADPEVPPIMLTTAGAPMELRCLIAIIRHGDRTPKQKMKMEVKHSNDLFSVRFFSLFEKYGGYVKGQLKMKHPRHLQEVLDIARELLNELGKHSPPPPPELEEKKVKLIQLKSVLEMYGYFSGINRKIQFKYQPKGFHHHHHRHNSAQSLVLDGAVECGENGGNSSSSSSSSSSIGSATPSLLLILKWGGELTAAGKTQAEELGKAFRCMYPSYGDAPGLGLLRLHSTFRHDLKIYASDEGRVQMTAAAFAKGFLALEGELTPILVQMVKSGSHINGLLDNADEARPHQRQARTTLTELVNINRDFTAEDLTKFNPCDTTSLQNAMSFVSNPHACCKEISAYIKALIQRVRQLKADPKYHDTTLYHGEIWELMLRRWSKLDKDFCRKDGLFDVSKIPDIYDCIKYDLHHNQRVVEFEHAEALYTKAKALADIVIPQEYGIQREEKLKVAASVSSPLLRKIKSDLLTNAHEGDGAFTMLDSRLSTGVSSPDRHVRTRLYFTSESHIHTMLNLIRYGGLSDEQQDPQWMRAIQYVGAVSELNYMTQIVIMMYEDPSKDPTSEERFHLEIHFSPGAYGVDGVSDDDYPIGFGYRPVEARAGSPTMSRVQSGKEMALGASAYDASHRVFDRDPFAAVQTGSHGGVQDPGSDSEMTMEDLQEEEEDVDEEESSTDRASEDTMRVCESDAGIALALSTDGGSSTQLVPPRWRRRLSGGSESTDLCTEGAPFKEKEEELMPLKIDRSSSSPRVIAAYKSVRSNGGSAHQGCLARSFEDKYVNKMSCGDGQLMRALRRSLSPQAAAVALFNASSSHETWPAAARCDLQYRHHMLLPLVGPAAASLVPVDCMPATSANCCLYGDEMCKPRYVPSQQSFCYGSSQRSAGALISTKVISGSYSAPNLQDMDHSLGLEAYGMAVPEIRPLETLHNALNLNQFEQFLNKVMDDATVPAPPLRSFPSTPTDSYQHINKMAAAEVAETSQESTENA